MASFLSLTAIHSVHLLCLCYYEITGWSAGVAVPATEPVSEEHVRVLDDDWIVMIQHYQTAAL